ncbi:hypothetical protein EPN52_11295 [bacterium]|nr:MAG: hypothetical protein EPN52_11295 [bacterium]
MIGGFFRRNLKLKALSLALAILAWAYLTYGANPGVRAGITQQVEVPIVVRNLAAGLVAQPVAQTVTVIVSGDRGPFDAPASKEFVAYVDLHGLSTGTFSLVPRVVGPKDINVERVRPASIVVSVDRLVSRRLPVTVQYRGRPQGSATVGANVVPTTVLVRGPASQLSRIVIVAAEVPGDRLTVGFDALLAPAALDLNGHPLGEITISPNVVHVSVPKSVTTSQ